MRIRLYLLVLFVFLGQVLPAVAQVRFDRIGTSQGLSQSTVVQIFQDHKGFLWFATSDGLNRYDGYHFNVYRHASDDPSTLSSSDISSFTEDSKGNMWVGTHTSGLNKINVETGKVTRFVKIDKGDNLSNLSVTSIVEDNDKNIWASTNNYGLLKINPQNSSIQHFSSVYQTLPVNSVSQIFKDANGKLWMGTPTGDLLEYLGGEDFSYHFNDAAPGPQKSNILCMTSDRAGNILFGTGGNGIFRYDVHTNKFSRVFFNASHSNRENIITGITHDKQGNLWIATDSGALFVQGEDFSKVTYFESNPDPDLGLSSFSVTSIFVDKDENVWLGTWEAGLNVIYKRRAKIAVYRYKPNTSQGLLSNKVTALSGDGKSIVWIGSNTGLTRFNRATNNYVHFVRSENLSRFGGSNDVNLLMTDQEGTLFVGIWGKGLDILREGSSVFEHYNYWEGSTAGNFTCIATADKDRIWLGTQGFGLILFNKRTNKFETSDAPLGEHGDLQGMHINSILTDRNNNLWIGTYSSGVYVYNFSAKKMVSYTQSEKEGSLSDNHVSKIFQDTQNRIWIATNGGGLNLFEDKTKTFKVFTVKDGLPSNTLKAILEDGRHNLWISTNGGLSRLDNKTMKFSNFDELDGIQGKEFIINAFYKDNQGEMFFGGVNGLNVFHPDSLQNSKKIPSVYLTGLKLFNKPVIVGDENSPLTKDIAETSEITLQANQSVFSIDFIALDFQKLKNNRYAYMLEGFDQDWNYVGTQRSATYTNLNAGTYIFKVKTTNSDGVWSEKPTELKIIILPPWYKTWWAFVLYGLIVVGALLALRRVIEIRERFKSDIRIKEIEKERIQELDRLKTNFFTNISHEFRTPLTLIISPLEKYFLENPTLPAKQQGQLNTIYGNARKLLKLINQLLDLSKLESGRFTPIITRNDMVEHIAKIVNSFENLANQKQIDLSFKSETEHLLVYFDADIIEKTVSNLLSNAFKYTPEKGRIQVMLRVYMNSNEAEKVEIEISDTGIGISNDHLPNIFNRFYQIQDKKQQVQVLGTGVGLSLCKELVELHGGEISVTSKVGEGTIFNVELPVRREDFDKSWISEEIFEKQDLQKERVSQERQQVVSAKNDKPILLIAEDNDELRNYIRDIFAENFQVIDVENGGIALEKARELIPDLIISDWMMPELTGVELCEAIKTDERTSHIPVIILTSKSSNESQKEGLETGADDYITKPFNAGLLELRVKNLLESRKKLRERFGKEVKLQPRDIAITSTDETFLQKAIKAVEENMENTDFDVDGLESALGMSKMQLYRKLKGLTDYSGNEFIRSIRLKRAVQLLETDSFTVAEVAYKVGFNDPAYFARAFKKEFGKSPKEYFLEIKN